MICSCNHHVHNKQPCVAMYRTVVEFYCRCSCRKLRNFTSQKHCPVWLAGKQPSFPEFRDTLECCLSQTLWLSRSRGNFRQLFGEFLLIFPVLESGTFGQLQNMLYLRTSSANFVVHILTSPSITIVQGVQSCHFFLDVVSVIYERTSNVLEFQNFVSCIEHWINGVVYLLGEW